MKTIKRYPLLFLGLALAMIVMSACSPGSSTTSSLTPLQVLQNSANTMKNLQSSHEDLKLTLQTNGISTNNNDLPIPPKVTVEGSGVEAIADKQQKMDFKVTLPNLSFPISDVIAGDKIYIKIAQGQWYVIDKAKVDQASGGLISRLLSGTPIDESTLLSLFKHINITDHGTENLNGQSLRHITANMDKVALQQLLLDNPQLQNQLGTQNLNAVKDFSASLDLYIDENHFYTHRTELKVNLGMDNNGKTATANVDLTIDLSNFNQPVTITAPANATPLTDPKQLLGELSKLQH